MKLPGRRRPPKTAVQGRLTDSLDRAIEISRTLPNSEICTPLLEEVRDGKITPTQAGSLRTARLAAKAREQ